MHDMGRVNLCYEISLLQPIHHRDLEIRLRGPGGIDGARPCASSRDMNDSSMLSAAETSSRRER